MLWTLCKINFKGAGGNFKGAGGGGLKHASVLLI